MGPLPFPCEDREEGEEEEVPAAVAVVSLASIIIPPSPLLAAKRLLEETSGHVLGERTPKGFPDDASSESLSGWAIGAMAPFAAVG